MRMGLLDQVEAALEALAAVKPTFDDQRARSRPCPRNRHALTGGVEAWVWLTCDFCEPRMAGRPPARPVGRFGAMWAQPDMERGE